MRNHNVSSSTFCNVLLQLWHALWLERAFVTREGQIMASCKLIFLFYFSRFFQLSDHIFNRKEELCCETVPVALGLETYRVKVLSKKIDALCSKEAEWSSNSTWLMRWRWRWSMLGLAWKPILNWLSGCLEKNNSDELYLKGAPPGCNLLPDLLHLLK